MTYVKVSIPKVEGGGAALPKKDRISIFDADDIASDIVRTPGSTKSAGPITLNAGAKGVSIQVTRSSISCGYENSGDIDAKVAKDKVEFDYPGDTEEFNNFVEAHLNKGMVIIVESCDGPTKVYGRKCNPMHLTAEPTDNNESRKTHLSFEQEMGDAFLPTEYTGTIPDVAEDASEGSGSGGGEGI